MKVRLFHLYFVLFYIGGFSSFGQSKFQKNIYAGFGASVFRMNDKAVSPLEYNALLPSAILGVEVDGEKNLFRIEANGNLGNLTPKGKDGNTGRLNQKSLDTRAFYYRKWSEGNQASQFFFGAYSGLLLRYKLHNRLGNSAEVYDYMFSIGPSAGYERALNSNKYSFRAFLSLPLLAYVIRPSYTNISHALTPNVSRFRERAKEHGLTLPGRLWMPVTNLELEKHFQRKGSMALQYRWEFIDYNHISRLQSAQHQILLVYNLGIGK